MKRRLAPVLAAVLLAPAAALAAPAPGWNSGYDGWWPGGYGYAPGTVRAGSYPCWVKVYGPTFDTRSHAWHQSYGARAHCSGGVGTRELTVSEQVLGPGGRTWFTIAGSTATIGPSHADPVRLRLRRPAHLGHVYRTVVAAELVVPNGHAGCSLSNTCDESIHVTAISRRLAP